MENIDVTTRMTGIEKANNNQFARNSTIVISQWSGRLGNNLIQLSNAIFLCLRYECRLNYPEHKFIRNKTFDFSTTAPDAYYIGRFYDHRDCRGQWPGLVERRYIMLKYVRELLTFDLDHQKIPKDENRLVLQIRSGDSFNTRPNPRYVPSPLSFFTKIMRDYADQEIIIVCEDLKNPCIEKLAADHANCRIQSSDLPSDVQTIINASNLVITLGTFGFVWALMSTKIKRLYVDDLPRQILDFGFFDQWNLGLDFETYRFRIYNYLQFGQWKNTPDQIELLLNHPENDVVLTLNEPSPTDLADYFSHSWKSFYGEQGHSKLLAGLKRFIQVTEDELQQQIICIDAGANTGSYLDHHLRHLCSNPGTQFLAFEPNPANLNALRNRVNMLADCDVKLFNCCLSDVDDTDILYNWKDSDSNQSGNVVAGLNAGGEKICEVEVYRLDTILKEIGGEPMIKFMKVDTEGSDTRIIKGLGKYLANTKYIIFEASDSLDDERGPGLDNPLQEIVDHLDKFGFNTYRIGTEKLLPMNGRYWNKIYEEKKFWSNCFALRKDDSLIEQLIDDTFSYRY